MISMIIASAFMDVLPHSLAEMHVGERNQKKQNRHCHENRILHRMTPVTDSIRFLTDALMPPCSATNVPGQDECRERQDPNRTLSHDLPPAPHRSVR
jgi:hypothetical protein